VSGNEHHGVSKHWVLYHSDGEFIAYSMSKRTIAAEQIDWPGSLLRECDCADPDAHVLEEGDE
jgi:hypothetical protein